MWGIIPAAGAGSRIQPLAFSKELLPVGSRFDGDKERPRAVSEYLVERMICGQADAVCVVISPWKSDIVAYYGAGIGRVPFTYVVQPEAAGLCDAIFRAIPFVPADETVLIGLPDTIWFPADGYCRLPDDRLSFLLFPVEHPEFFDAVVIDNEGRVNDIQVKQLNATSNWIWGAIKMPGAALRELYDMWCDRDCRDEYLGTLINAYLSKGGEAWGYPAGMAYVDVGTLHGYREAMTMLANLQLDERLASPVSPLPGKGERISVQSLEAFDGHFRHD